VSYLTRTLAALMLALYVLASMHCALEAVPGFAFLKSCCFVDSHSSPTHEPSDCESDGCTVEKAKYRPEEHGRWLPQPALCLTATFLLSELTLTGPPDRALTCECQAPPELGQTWQFIHRAAWPPRAPSPAA
jgi:hypothetical protein